MHNHSYENEFNLHVNEISFSYEKMSTKTRFQKEATGNSKMACSRLTISVIPYMDMFEGTWTLTGPEIQVMSW